MRSRLLSIFVFLGIQGILFSQSIDDKVNALIDKMTIEEKIGQLSQQNAPGLDLELIRQGKIGSILNEPNVDNVNKLQRLAVEESRLGIPIIFARDVIHGFKTIFPIPLGQSATWNPKLVESGAQVAAMEARKNGTRWTFAPMIDVSNDPRWGRIAEGFGEDTYLTSVMGVSSVRGYQGKNIYGKNSLIACAKHFVAYGAGQGGRDYHTVTLPENEIRDKYLPPFKACLDEGAATVMSAFNEINGIPATANKKYLNDVLREEWGFGGFVVSDWASVEELETHGFSENQKEAAKSAFNAGCDMEMATWTYANYLEELIQEGVISTEKLDDAVGRILRIKFEMGLFDEPYTDPEAYPMEANTEYKALAKQSAQESLVLLKNKNNILPLENNFQKVAVIGPLANAPHEQLGTWVFDGDKNDSQTPLTALEEHFGIGNVEYAPGLEYSRANTEEHFSSAMVAATNSDVVILFIGEESILSGEAHSRADIGLPGKQTELIELLSKSGKPIIAVVMAGRPLTFEKEFEKLDAVIYAWHPGTMGGPAITDVLLGKYNPSGKLPITFPRHVGQIPIYYNEKSSGKPATNDTWIKMDDIPIHAVQYSIGNTNHYLDYGFKPWFPFGFGLSYTQFMYSDLALNDTVFSMTDSIQVKVQIKNIGEYDGEEVAQLYIRDLFGSRTRPVKELKRFKKVMIDHGASEIITFSIHPNELGFHDANNKYVTEPGEFKLGIGGNSDIELTTSFYIK